MRKIRVLSKKFDGSLRDEYETYLYAETGETITLFCVPGLSCWDHRKVAWSEAPDGVLEIYFKRRWYNVRHICEQTSHRNLMYINIAMPATLQSNCLKWTDLDLDYRVHMDNSVELLDQEEYKQNARALQYGPDLKKQVRRACRDVEALLATRDYPFDHERQVELYLWIKEELRSG